MLFADLLSSSLLKKARIQYPSPTNIFDFTFTFSRSEKQWLPRRLHNNNNNNNNNNIIIIMILELFLRCRDSVQYVSKPKQTIKFVVLIDDKPCSFLLAEKLGH